MLKINSLVIYYNFELHKLELQGRMQSLEFGEIDFYKMVWLFLLSNKHYNIDLGCHVTSYNQALEGYILFHGY